MTFCPIPAEEMQPNVTWLIICSSNAMYVFQTRVSDFLGVPELIHHLNKNHSYWKELHDKGCKKIEEDKS